MAAQLPLTFQWTAIAMLLGLAGIFDQTLGILGLLGLFVTLAHALQAWSNLPPSQGPHQQGDFGWIVDLGPLLRSLAREVAKWSFAPDASGGPDDINAAERENSGMGLSPEGAPEAPGRPRTSTR